jgi:hypothetical protein
MKSVASLTVVACFLGATLTLNAQERLESLGPIRQAIAHEAALLAVQQKPAADPGWWRVTAITPGTQLAIVGRDGRVRVGRFTSADDAELAIVHLSGAPIPFAARRAVENAVSAHPDYFVKAQRGQSFPLSLNVRLTPDGVFVFDERVIALDQLVEAIARAEVEKITSSSKTGGSVPWAIGGAALGAALGTVSTVPFRYSTCGCALPLIGLSLVGLPIASGMLGYQYGRHDVQRIIYRAPK